MKLIKDKREARWIPKNNTDMRQTRRGKGGATFALVEFDGTKQEQVTAARLGRTAPRHRSWVNMSNLEGHGGI